MGPLFAIVSLGTAGALVFAVGVIIGCLYGFGLSRASLISIAFCAGGAVGAFVAMLFGVAILGRGATLTTRTGVLTYLGSLIFCGIVGALMLARIAVVQTRN